MTRHVAVAQTARVQIGSAPNIRDALPVASFTMEVDSRVAAFRLAGPVNPGSDPRPRKPENGPC
jgi:hypothetical protein